ncbi:hypothetical protein YC2023_083706 [Brassica napus]
MGFFGVYRYILTCAHFHLFHHKEEDYAVSVCLKLSQASSVSYSPVRFHHLSGITTPDSLKLTLSRRPSEAHTLSSPDPLKLTFLTTLSGQIFLILILSEKELHPLSSSKKLSSFRTFPLKLRPSSSSLSLDEKRCKLRASLECPGIRRSIWKEEFNMNMFEEEFWVVVVTGAEGWSAQHGEASLNYRVGGDDGDEADSQPAAETQAAAETETQPQAQTQTQCQTQPAAQTHSESSRGKRKRKDKDMVVEACDKHTEALMVKNMIAERMLERQEASSVENVLEILYTLPGVREWSPLYEASIEYLIDSYGSRRAFITMKIDEAKIKFLELRTKIKRDD